MDFSTDQLGEDDMNPKISIIIPVYNGENYLKEAIDSALAQTYDNYEIIVINDGSVDHTEEIALSYGKKLRYLKKENGGVASALNLGIKKMDGEYFSWLSHDDVYYPEKLQVQIEHLRKAGNMTLPVYGNWDIFYMEDKNIEKRPVDFRYHEKQMCNGVVPVVYGLVNGCNMLIHRCHFDRVGLFNEALLTAQDYDMWFRIFRDRTLLYINEPLIKYRVHKTQGSNVIEDYEKNCQDFQIKMIQDLNKGEVESLFGGYYKFYFDMLMMAKNNHWKDVYKKVWKLFLDEKGIVKEQLQFLKGKRLVLFCAGRNGKRLKRELYLRGIDIYSFCDSDQEKWYTQIEDVKCIPPDELRTDDIILVTKDEPSDIILELKRRRFKNLYTYEEIANLVFESIPLKERVLSYFNSEILD